MVLYSLVELCGLALTVGSGIALKKKKIDKYKLNSKGKL